jgi:hypothetical protein
VLLLGNKPILYLSRQGQGKARQIPLLSSTFFTSACFVSVQATRLTEVKKEEYQLLEAQSIPLRNYLMQHVMPTLTQALIDCCQSRPDDPIDYIVSFFGLHYACE